MTKAMNYCIGLSIVLLAVQTLAAQDYKTTVSNSKDMQLVLKDFNGELPIEGYPGKEIIISGDPDITMPERAKGLKPVYSGGVDNTGLGISVEKSGNKITIICLLPFKEIHRPAGALHYQRNGRCSLQRDQQG